MTERHIGIVGSGLIGRSWSLLFAAQGYEVRLYDSVPSQVTAAIDEVLVQLGYLKEHGLLRGQLSIQQQHALIKPCSSLRECVSGAKYVQECIPENLELKTNIFKEIDCHADNNTVLGSSTSALPVSTFAPDLQHKDQVIVAHPTNPPFFCPLTEVCPAPYTQPWVIETTLSLMRQIGQVPVIIKKELPGFVLNRMQYALLSECWRLIQEDAISVEDIDKVMKDGLGMRYAFCGPFETCHLNAEGFENYCERYGDMIYGIATSFGPTPKWEGPTRLKITSEIGEQVPLDTLAERRKWRDARLTALAKLKKDISK